jgi:NAD(P)H-hydrate epimerase
MLESATCVIDALLGTGKMRPLEGVFKKVLEKTAAEKLKRNIFIVAVDLPSGMDADTGAVDPACPYADLTITLAFLRDYLPSRRGKGREIDCSDIGIPESLADAINIELMT